MYTGLTQDEMHMLLRDMTEICLRPPEAEAWRVQPVGPKDIPRERTSPLGRLCATLDAMRPWSLPLVAAVALVPLVAVSLMVALLGPAVSLIMLAGSAMLGGIVVMQQGQMAFRSLAECISGLQTGRSVSHETAQRAVRVAGGLLLVLPDPLTSCLGLVMLVSALQRRLAGWLQRQTSPVYTLS